MTVPSGIFLTGAINLRSHVELYLNRGAVIRGSLRIPEDYPHRALIYAENIEDAGISGDGIIDGYSNHPSYKERFRVNDGKRPRGIFLIIVSECHCVIFIYAMPVVGLCVYWDVMG